MSKKTLTAILASILTGGLVIACGMLPALQAATAPGPASPPAAETSPPQPLPSPRFVQTLFGVTVEGAQKDVYRPLETYQCAMLGDVIQQAIRVPVRLETVAFTDQVSAASGTACRILASGSGQDFAGIEDVYAGIKAALQASGWTEDNAYAAGGATGISGGFRDGSALAIVTVIWNPAPEAGCPSDQPISACTLAPEQRLYEITIDLAQK